MGFIIFIIITIFATLIFIIYLAIKSDKKHPYYDKDFYYDFDDDDLEDDLLNGDFIKDYRDSYSSSKNDSAFPYPDPSETDPSKMAPADLAYLNEDGDLNEDL